MVGIDYANLGIDLFNALFVVSNVENPFICLLGGFVDAFKTVTSDNKNTIDATTARLKLGKPFVLGIKTLVVFLRLTRRRRSHVFKLTTIEDIVVEFLRFELL